MHLWEDCYLVEIINPETGEPVPDGEIGELVLTTLDREMMPLIRYRTRDLTRILPGTCPCGRTHLRIDRIKGRSDDMFIIKGVNIFPMQVEKVLVQFLFLNLNFQFLNGLYSLPPPSYPEFLKNSTKVRRMHSL